MANLPSFKGLTMKPVNLTQLRAFRYETGITNLYFVFAKSLKRYFDIHTIHGSASA